MVSEKKSAKKKDRPCVRAYKSMKKNPWIAASIVLGIVLIGVLYMNMSVNVSGQQAAQNLIDYAAVQGAQLELIEVNDAGDLYEVVVSIEGQEGSFYVTKDGESYTSILMPFESSATPSTNTNTQPAATEVPKSETPVVDLYVWSYCPYGVQAQGPMAEVADLLGDYAEFNTVLFHDGHGEYEAQQNKIQACIQDIAPEKYWDYAAGFVSDIYSKCGSTRDAECDKTESIKLMNSLGISSTEVMSCVETRGDELFNADKAAASQNGVSGSPTVIINGVKANVGRTAEAYKTAVCAAFNDAPEECGEVIESTAAATTNTAPAQY